MFGLKRPQFKSKKDAFRTFFSYFSAPGFIVLIGIAGVTKTQGSNYISPAQAKQSILLIVIAALISLPFWWYKAFYAIYAIMNDDYGNEPETVICLNCHKPFYYNQIKSLKCPQCSGTLEDLAGFYERHPELRDDEPKK